jgi:hypothetical protein
LEAGDTDVDEPGDTDVDEPLEAGDTDVDEPLEAGANVDEPLEAGANVDEPWGTNENIRSAIRSAVREQYVLDKAFVDHLRQLGVIGADAPSGGAIDAGAPSGGAIDAGAPSGGAIDAGAPSEDALSDDGGIDPAELLMQLDDVVHPLPTPTRVPKVADPAVGVLKYAKNERTLTQYDYFKGKPDADNRASVLLADFPEAARTTLGGQLETRQPRASSRTIPNSVWENTYETAEALYHSVYMMRLTSTRRWRGWQLTPEGTYSLVQAREAELVAMLFVAVQVDLSLLSPHALQAWALGIARGGEPAWDEWCNKPGVAHRLNNMTPLARIKEVKRRLIEKNAYLDLVGEVVDAESDLAALTTQGAGIEEEGASEGAPFYEPGWRHSTEADEELIRGFFN